MGTVRRHHGAGDTLHCRLRCIHRQDTKRGNVLQSVRNLLDYRVKYTLPGDRTPSPANGGTGRFFRTDRSRGRDAGAAVSA